MPLSKYEKKELEKIHAWKNPPKSWFGQTLDTLYYPIKTAGDLVTQIPGVDWVVEKALGGVVSYLNDAAHWSISKDSIYQDYEKNGHDLQAEGGVFSLDLEVVDNMLGYIDVKYKGISFAEGAAAGYAGLMALVPDIIALITLNQRAIAEYAAYCGFDISSQQERIFALHTLAYASSPSDAAKGAAMAQLVKIAKEVAQKKTWKDLETHVFVQLIRQIAKSLSIRLTKDKLAQVIPVTGAVIGGGFNAYYTGKVCNAAFYLYRERFLAEKYGTSIVTNP